MNSEILIALIAFGGTTVGSIVGAIVSSKVTNYRLLELEKKQDKHNSIIERMFVVEGKIVNIEGKVNKI